MKKISFFIVLIVFLPFLGKAIERTFNCKITKEIENNKSATKRLFLNKSIKIFLDSSESWLYEKNKKDWINENSELLHRVSFFFDQSETKLSFKLKKFNTESKKNLESLDQIVIDRNTKKMTFLKSFFKYDQKVYFSTQLNGICD